MKRTSKYLILKLAQSTNLFFAPQSNYTHVFAIFRFITCFPGCLCSCSLLRKCRKQGNGRFQQKPISNFFTYSFHRVNIPSTYPHFDTRQVGCSFLKSTYFPIRVKPYFYRFTANQPIFATKKRISLIFRKKEIPKFLSIFGLFHPFL